MKNDNVIKEVKNIQQDFLLKLQKIQSKRDSRISNILKKQSQAKLAEALADIQKTL